MRHHTFSLTRGSRDVFLAITTIFLLSASFEIFAQDYGAPARRLPAPNDSGSRKFLDLPPSWRTPESPKSRKRGLPPHLAAGRDENERGSVRTTSADWLPDFALGAGVNFPEIVPIDVQMIFNQWFRLRLFFGPPIPFNIRVEMPSDLISSKNGVAVANPDYVIRMKAVYGPHYGAEAMLFPFQDSFFVAGGYSIRQLKLEGEAKSGVLVCSVTEAAKEPPCGDPSARLTTRTELEVGAKAATEAHLARLSLGWAWTIGQGGFFTLYGGAAQPVSSRRRVEVTTGIDSKGGEGSDAISGALADLKLEKEAELERKAAKEIAPYDRKIVPILGLGGGFTF